MSHVFRLYKGGSNTYEGWNDSPTFPYNSTNRNTIEDPMGATAQQEITSIPSPFARIDLVKLAFGEVCKRGLDGNTIFHKMVSGSLDVGEIFFNIDKYKGKIEIVPCDIRKMIEDLKGDDNIHHGYLADALDKYLLSDEKSYNFDRMKNIYLLNYLNGPDELNIIGATSPATLFFCSANDLSYVNDVYFKDQDRPFDNAYQPLYKRDFEYVKTYFIYRHKIPNFSSLFPEIEEYLRLTFSKLPDDKRRELRNIDANSANSYEGIDVHYKGNFDKVEVLGTDILKEVHKEVSALSEFTIKPTNKVNESLPLVLPVESGGKYDELFYVKGKWGKENKAPYKDEEDDYTKRTLPYEGSFDPYLTIGDLLEDTLISVPHTLNTDNYFSGNIKIDKPKLSYLIPIKPLFFKFFSVDDLISRLSDGKNFFEMNMLSGDSVKVILRIPIKGNGKISYIEYSRLYYKDRVAVVSSGKNEGGIREFDFTGLIMPIVKFNDPEAAYYTVACINDTYDVYDFTFYKGDSSLVKSNCACRNKYIYGYNSVNYSIEGSNFDFIQVRDKKSGYKGLIVPKFKVQESINRFNFSVDLGTSNTHIEYNTYNFVNSKPFDYNKEDTLACRIYKPSFDQYGGQIDLADEEGLMIKDFIPDQVGNGDFKFPLRSVLSTSKGIDWELHQEPYLLYNLSITYDKRECLPYNDSYYDMKWGKGNDQHALKAYIECLVLMLRNKVLMNNGDLRKTKLTWFYPVSMSHTRVQNMKSTWNECYKKYFFNAQNIDFMVESVAPIIYYFDKIPTTSNLINIDIGGGTTDIAFAKDKKVLGITSFKYAANVLFEDSFANNTNNGIVDYYRKRLSDLLSEKKGSGLDEINELKRIAESATNQNPANMASFLFSLRQNSLIAKAGINKDVVDFNSLLRDDGEYKIVFIIFYVSIIYHVAHIVKWKNLKEPRHITFSGNGSRIVKILSLDNELLAKFTKIIFEKVLGHPYDGELELLGLDDEVNPKEVTCKGGILGTVESDEFDTLILKGDNSGFVDPGILYKDLDCDYKKKILSSVRQFFDFVFSLNRSFNYNKYFEVNRESLKIASEVCLKDLDIYLDKGIAQRMEDGGINEIEETAFFYPIKGVINALSQAIYKKCKK